MSRRRLPPSTVSGTVLLLQSESDFVSRRPNVVTETSHDSVPPTTAPETSVPFGDDL